jgi:hypothetical protein
MLGRYFALLAKAERFFKRHVEDTDFPRGGDFAGGTGLWIDEIRALLRARGRARIVKLNKATGKISQTVPGKVEHDRLIPANQPNASADPTALPVINFAFENAVVNPPGHNFAIFDGPQQVASAEELRSKKQTKRRHPEEPNAAVGDCFSIP